MAEPVILSPDDFLTELERVMNIIEPLYTNDQINRESFINDPVKRAGLCRLYDSILLKKENLTDLINGRYEVNIEPLSTSLKNRATQVINKINKFSAEIEKKNRCPDVVVDRRRTSGRRTGRRTGRRRTGRRTSRAMGFFTKRGKRSGKKSGKRRGRRSGKRSRTN